MAKEKIETLDVQRKKKKNIFYIIGIILLLGVIFVSFLIEFLNTEKVYKARTADVEVENRAVENTTLGLNKNTYKQNWAIAIENKMEKQESELKSTLEDINKMIIKQTEILEENNKKIDQVNQKSEENKLKTQEALIQTEQNTKNWIKAVQNQNRKELEQRIKFLNSKIQNIKTNTGGNVVVMPKDEKSKDAKTVETGNIDPNELPKKPNEIAAPTGEVEKVIIEEKKIVPPVIVQNLDTSKQVAIINQQKDEAEQLEQAKQDYINEKIKQEEIQSSFHIMTGFSKAYMITGAYAPVFSAGQSQPLPVLMQIEGDILIANDDTMSIDKCFLIGSATGNMNSETADIRLVKISCSLFNGTKKVEGSISGWAISEKGIPGIPGVLVHKNGALLAKTFVAGFMQQLSGFLSNVGGYVGVPQNEQDINNQNLGQDFQSAVAGGLGAGLQSVFGKLSDYYLKMAEQIFPVVEVKGGRTISILLSGGEDFSITDLKKLSIDTIEEEEDAKEKRINEILFSDSLIDIDYINADNGIQNNNKGGQK